MDVIESIKRDKAYIKCKLLVKNWEKDFKTKCSRTPSKFDIKEAPAKVRYAYKKYFQLKSAALDSTLSVCDFEDDLTCSPDPVPSLESFIPNALSPDSEQFMQTLPSGSELEELLISAKHKESKPNIIKSETKPLSPFSNNLSKKLFESRKFSIRNPRKLSLQKSQPSRENSEDQENISLNDVTVEDVSFSLFSFDKERPSFNRITDSSAPPPSGSFINAFDNVSVRHINKAWLERATGVATQDKVVHQQLTTKMVTKESLGIRNIIKPVAEKQSDYVENSESDTDDPVINKLKPALKKRKISELLVQEQNENASSITTMTEEPNQHVKESDEKPRKRKSKVTKKIVHQEDTQKPDITEFLPFGLEDNVTPRHTNVTSVLNNVKSSQLKKTQDIATPEDKLDEKIKKGTLNENFVRINIEKKVFVRGKKTMNYSKYKKKLNKDKKALHAGMEFPESGKISCFKCGGGGHMARYCTAHKGDTLMPLSDCNVEDDIPTLEEMENMICLKNKNFDQSNTEQLMETLYKPSVIPDTFLNALASNPVQNVNNTEVKPIYTEQCDPSEELEKVLNLFGHNSFRSGQEQSIMRILNGKSTLLVLSTGGGKSLCYQIPAYIYSQHYKCITLVISPLVSLMEDQVLSMPDFLRAGCLHTNQPSTQRQKIMQYIKDGELNILLISPEALVSGDVAGFAGLFKSLPPIAFACIDEAHCVSQWSHNFRPSYLMICRVLREKLNVNCILGLTATASQSTIKSVIDHINIPDGFNGVITNPTLPDNLSLSVSFAKDKDRALISLLASETIEKYNSIIVYCIRRDECTRVAAVLRSTLQEPGKQNMEAQSKKRKRMSYIAEAYHAGMSAAQRKKIQKHFMDGVLRIIVATVAFGMGINKSDIRCIIHYNMPSSFESYVQEVGRAGRDGKPAHCHVFMSNNNNDKNELLKHIHANTIDRPTIRKLIQKIFYQCECNKKNPANDAISPSAQHVRCPGHEVGIPIDQTVEELDMSSENISTLLCYLELHPKKYVKVLNNAYTLCKIISYGGAAKILTAAKTNQALAMAYLMESKKNLDVMKSNVLEFPVIEVAAAIGKDSGMVKYQLKNLEWLTESGTSKRSALKVEFNTLGFRIKAPGDLSSTELDEMLDDLHNSVLCQEKTMLYQLEEINKAFQKLGKHSSDNQQDADFMKEKSQELKLTIRNYFEREDPCNNEIILEKRPLDEERVISDVRALIITYKDCSFTGRSIARIFQGISSPNYPAIVWGRCKFWRTHIHEDFYGLIRIATQQIIQMK